MLTPSITLGEARLIHPEGGSFLELDRNREIEAIYSCYRFEGALLSGIRNCARKSHDVEYPTRLKQHARYVLQPNAVGLSSVADDNIGL
jgi:hypothetical protein